ncbi:T9SS type A sorting domain-containing protein [Chryseobacterium indologenes]|nr:T9SS type A sorting domain-containing protein [Chryseobacterium indologenes]
MTFGVNGSLSVVANDLTYASLIKVVNNSLYVYSLNPYWTTPVERVGKFDFNGVKSTSFGTNGILSFSNNRLANFNYMIENVDQSLFVIAISGGNKKILKIDANGVIDPNFISSDLDAKPVFGLTQLSNNNVLITYNDSSVSKNYLKRYTYQGQTDNTFGDQGITYLDSNNNQIVVNNLDEIFVFNKIGTQQIIKKYASNGLIDTTFGTNGVFDIASFNTGKTININNIDLDSNSSVLLFGGAIGVGETNSFIARINSNGSLDTNFHGNSSYFMAPDSFADNLLGKVINDNEYICFNKVAGSSMVSYKSLKYTRNGTPALGLQDMKYNNSIKIYPNPASDFITIEVGKNDKINKINIYTMTGEFVLSSKKSEVDIKDIATGSYMIEATVNDKIYKSKFIKK